MKTLEALTRGLCFGLTIPAQIANVQQIPEESYVMRDDIKGLVSWQMGGLAGLLTHGAGAAYMINTGYGKEYWIGMALTNAYAWYKNR